MNYIYRYFTLTIILLSGVFQSCLTEDRSDCPDDTDEFSVTVFYDYTDREGLTRSVDPHEIENVSLYVFDELGTLAGVYIDDEPQFGRSYFQTPDLDPGTYGFVSWLNLVGCCYALSPADMQVGVSTINDLNLDVVRGADDTVRSHIKNLFYGRLGRAAVKAGTRNVFTVPVIRDTYTINVSTEGLSTAHRDHALKITDRNGCLRFDNSLTKAYDVCYYTDMERSDTGQLQGSRTVLRLFEDYRNAVIRVKDLETSSYIFDDNLVETILKTVRTPVSFDDTYEFDITLRFNEAGQNVSIVVNGWEMIYDNGNIGG